MRVLRTFPQNQLRIVFIEEGKTPASVELPADWLYADVPDGEIRARLSAVIPAKPGRSDSRTVKSQASGTSAPGKSQN